MTTIHPILVSSDGKMGVIDFVGAWLASSAIGPMLGGDVVQANAGYTGPYPEILHPPEVVLARTPDYPETVFRPILTTRLGQHPSAELLYADYEPKPEHDDGSNRFDRAADPYRVAEIEWAARLGAQCEAAMYARGKRLPRTLWNCPGHFGPHVDPDAVRSIHQAFGSDYAILNAYADRGEHERAYVTGGVHGLHEILRPVGISRVVVAVMPHDRSTGGFFDAECGRRKGAAIAASRADAFVYINMTHLGQGGSARKMEAFFDGLAKGLE